MCFRKTDKRKIYKTTDGYLESKPHIKKPRHVAVVEQRKDKAVGVVKIFSKDGKNQNTKVKNLTLKPKKNRQSITEESVVENKLLIGRKVRKNDTTTYEVFYPQNFYETGDKLTFFEYLKLKLNLQNNNKKQKKAHKEKIKKWKRHFK